MRRVKKSRNGCARCKSKRVKCGEEKPHCSRCTRLGVKCPGYVQSLRWVNNHINHHDTATKEPSSKTAPSPASSIAEQSIYPPPALPSTLGGDEGSNPVTGQVLPDTPTLDADGTSILCENLWDFHGDSLPELEGLSSPSLVSTSGVSQQLGTPLPVDLTATDPSCLSSSAAPVSPGDDHRNFGHLSPASIVRSYPPSSRRPPHRDAFIPPSLNHNSSWTLIEYYFKEVAALFSSYDSQMNPFRSTVSRLWGSSLAICRTMQSMAAATLVHDFPQFGPMGLKMRDEAAEILNNETTALDDKSLLALLMLGQTASWHDPKDLGISFFNLLRKHVNSMTSNQVGGRSRNKNYQFFEEALIYWEMLLSFVADNDSVTSSGSASTSGMQDSLDLQRMPHPWTGIARDTHSTVQEVGRLVRQERKRVRGQRFTSQEGITQAQKAIDHARQLEEQLLELAHPAEGEIVSPGDDDTPVWHLLTMAEGYRCTGLMQLYRVFPDLLRRRLPVRNNNAADRDPFLSDPIMDGLCHFPSLNVDNNNNNNNSSSSSNSNKNDNASTASSKLPDTYYDTWLTEFALTSISRLRTIPMESRTRCVQPFLLVTCCSELRLPRDPSDNNNNTSHCPTSPTDSPSNNDSSEGATAVEVLRTRKFILSRLTSYLHVLPPKPIHVCLQLVREVWRRMDEGESGVYWMDVMIEKGWETTMG